MQWVWVRTRLAANGAPAQGLHAERRLLVRRAAAVCCGASRRGSRRKLRRAAAAAAGPHGCHKHSTIRAAEEARHAAVVVAVGPVGAAAAGGDVGLAAGRQRLRIVRLPLHRGRGKAPAGQQRSQAAGRCAAPEDAAVGFAAKRRQRQAAERRGCPLCCERLGGGVRVRGAHDDVCVCVCY